MKTLHKFLFAMVLFLGATLQMQGQSTVWFFDDFSPDHIAAFHFTVNGETAFSLRPEVKKCWGTTSWGQPINTYKRCARKVIFENPGSYVVGTGYLYSGADMHTEVNLNVEDGQTYYVRIHVKPMGAISSEVLTEKQGLKLLKQAQNTKKYTINEDFVYTGK